MDKKKLNEYRDKLLKKHAELTKGFARNKSVTEEAASGSEDFVDYAVSAYTKEFLLSLSDLDRKNLQIVEEALTRISREEYGECLECGKAIGEKRLQAVPWTPCCIACQELAERESSRAASAGSTSARYHVD